MAHSVKSSYPAGALHATVLKVFEPRRKPRAPASNALDILNPCYSLHVVTELESGPRHFNDLARSIPASGNTLSSRLRMLEKHGIISRKVLGYMPPSVLYRLTEKGKGLADIIRLIGDWDAHWFCQEETPANPKVAEERKPYKKKR